MKLNKLYLRDFRNYGELNLEFSPGVNLIVGRNAQGKTNLLEAIGYLGSGKSFRAQKTGEMVRFSADFAEISGEVTAEDRDQSLRWLLFSGSRPRQIFRNGAKKKSASDMAGVLPTVLFCPEDLQMLKSGSAPRRRFGDNALCQLRPNYDAALAEYGKILESKQQILKNYRERPEMLEILREYNERLCQVGAMIISYRARFFQALGQAAAVYHDRFSEGREVLTLDYKTVSTVNDPFVSIKEICEKLREHLDAHYRAELESSQSLTGPHKDDFVTSLSGIEIKAYGSQGQTRTATISLKLALREIMGKQFGEEPVLLLDDVLSELDAGRQDFVLNQIETGQVFITCCEPGRFTKIGKNIQIDAGAVVN